MEYLQRQYKTEVTTNLVDCMSAHTTAKMQMNTKTASERITKSLPWQRNRLRSHCHRASMMSSVQREAVFKTYILHTESSEICSTSVSFDLYTTTGKHNVHHRTQNLHWPEKVSSVMVDFPERLTTTSLSTAAQQKNTRDVYKRTL